MNLFVGQALKKIKFDGCVTIHICELGYSIKPNKQPEIRIPTRCAVRFVEIMRNPKKLFTIEEGINYLNFRKYDKEVSMFYKIKNKIKLDKNRDLGDKIETIYFPRLFSVKIFEFGIILKIEKQDPIILNKKQVDIICHYIRNKNVFKTISGIKKILKLKTATAI